MPVISPVLASIVIPGGSVPPSENVSVSATSGSEKKPETLIAEATVPSTPTWLGMAVGARLLTVGERL